MNERSRSHESALSRKDLAESPGSSSPGEIRLQLERILASPLFSGAQRLERFLSFTVGKTLRGEADEIKEYLLGVEVFDRGESFDPRIDPIVRVEARRLRDKLKEYYEGEGREDPVRIELPKGSYVPSFRLRRPAAAPGAGILPAAALGRAGKLLGLGLAVVLAGAGLYRLAGLRAPEPVANRPESLEITLAVLPLENLSGDPEQEHLADGLTEALITELSKIGGFRVKSRTTIMQYKGVRRPLPEIARELGADVVVEGGVMGAGPTIHFKARLVDAASDTKVWAGGFDGEAEQMVPLQIEVARSIAGALGRYRATRPSG